ncbi:IS66 family insertion sequence element accessory protein TnpB [Candidatus Trichorickettsia mobilis]|uniref:IS66 family insertion sequence element accessory protein TnpB n=1 Tax=Candidatus Trichorickettsia mobilis TaxID=1346319 RepID=UPI002931AE69|nr:IS66 family insertion sequence element accessory protein TnpB [Candidatus Trichorickettsia mobilis]
MLNVESGSKIYLCTGHTDMRKGINGLSLLAQSVISDKLNTGALFAFRGKRADRIKVLWWDGQGFCLYYKCLDIGKFVWPKLDEQKSLTITRAQLAMLIEAIDWRNPVRHDAPLCAG